MKLEIEALFLEKIENAQHGGMTDYLHGAIGLSPQELAELRRILLED